MPEAKLVKVMIALPGFVLIALVGSALVLSGLASASFKGRNGLLVYQAQAGAHKQLFTVKPDGADVRQITHFADSDADQGHWSPNGKRIVFNRHWNPERPGERIEIYTMNADGSGLHRLKLRGKINVEPSWFPDGRRIIFLGSGKGFDVANADGSGFHTIRISPWPNSVDEGNPRVSPDGRWVAWVRRSADGSKGAVFLVRTDGLKLHRLTRWSSGIADVVDWSPDGRRLVFSSPDFHHAGYSDVYTIRRNGKQLRQLTHSRRRNENGADSWSPDGKKIAFVSNREGIFQVYVMNRDGRQVRRLTHGAEAHTANWGTSP